MSKIIILGFALPSGEKQEIVQAHNIRSKQFLDVLVEDGNDVLYIARAQPHFPSKSESLPIKDYVMVDFSRPGWRRQIQSEIIRFDPDCLVSANFFTSYMATFLNYKCPVWLDINGDPTAEKQALLYRESTNKGLFPLPSMEFRILRYGDKFSTCSRPQRHAVIGKLGLSGRLNQYTFGYDFVHAVPPGFSSPHVSECKGSKRDVLLPNIGENDFILLWTGGYNVWMDPDTLFKGIESAMEKDANIRFVSTGGPVVNDGPYLRFRQLIEKSQQKHKFFFLGWIPRSDLLQLYNFCDLGVSIDAECYETELGTRTRLLEMIGFGLPVLITRGTEIGKTLAEHGYARLFKIGDYKELSTQILAHSVIQQKKRNLDKNELVQKARRQFNNMELCKPLINWSRNPVPAPDRGKISGHSILRGKLRGYLRDTKTRFWGGKYKEPEYKN